MVCKGTFFFDKLLVRYFRIQCQRETRLHYKSLKYWNESCQHAQFHLNTYHS